METMLSGQKCLEATVVHLIKMPEMMYNPKLRFITKLRWMEWIQVVCIEVDVFVRVCVWLGYVCVCGSAKETEYNRDTY